MKSENLWYLQNECMNWADFTWCNNFLLLSARVLCSCICWKKNIFKLYFCYFCINCSMLINCIRILTMFLLYKCFYEMFVNKMICSRKFIFTNVNFRSSVPMTFQLMTYFKSWLFWQMLFKCQIEIVLLWYFLRYSCWDGI